MQVTEGLVRVVEAGGKSYELTHIAVAGDIQSLEQMSGTMHFQTQEGKQVACETTISDLFSVDGRFQPERANIKGSLKSDGPIDPGADCRGAGAGFGLVGKANLSGSTDVTSGSGQAKLQMTFAGLQSQQMRAEHVRPQDVSLDGTANFAKGTISGLLAAKSEPNHEIQANLSGTYAREGASKLMFDLVRADLGAIGRILSRVRADQRMGGVLAGKIEPTRESDGAFHGGADFSLQSLSIGGRRISPTDAPMALTASGLMFDTGSGTYARTR